MRHIRTWCSVLMAAAASCGASTPLTLEYCVTPRGDGAFDYVFTLRLDNHDQSWVLGHSFNWIVFGDADRAASPFADFVGADPVPSPWTDEGFNFSSGTHNGPCLIDIGRFHEYRGWVPLDVGDSVEWGGTSRSDIHEGGLLWSNLIGSGSHASLEMAVRSEACHVTPPCAVADFNRDGGVDGGDIESFLTAWEANIGAADVNNDGGIDGGDLEMFFTYWALGGC